MRSIFRPALMLLGFLFSSSFIFSQDQCTPVGWATQNGGTTGGGSVSPITVSTLSALQSQASSSGAKVIYVSGNLGSGAGTRVSVAANKTIIGMPGATLYGGFDLKAKNIIIRNMAIRGPGAVDVDGVDCITIDGTAATNIWIDHCDIYDGQDGNLDISNGANYIAVTWCKFRYTSASSNHQFCNLIGSSDSKTSDRGKLKVTFMYNWWTTGCKERMPRLRFGQVHMVNNYFNCTGNNHCIRAGVEANLLVESNYFDGVRTPIDKYENNFTAITSRNNVFVSTSGNTTGGGTAFTPPYSLTIAPAANVKALVNSATCGAGATMASPTACGCGTPPVTYTLAINSSPAAGGSVTKNPNAGSYNSGTVVTLTATPAAGYAFASWSGDASGSAASVNVTMNSNKTVTANFTPLTYTLTTNSSPAAGGTVSKSPDAGNYNSGTVVTLTAIPAGGYAFTGWSGDASGSAASVNVTMTTNKTVTANFALITYALSTNSSPAAGGTIARSPNAGSYNSGTVVTLTATPATGYAFTGWSGDASGSAASVNVTMNSNKSVTANFALIPATYTLTTSALPAQGGSVSKNPDAAIYDAGTDVVLTATPASGYMFTGWSGDATGSSSSVTVNMTSDKNVTANFQLIPVTYTLTTNVSPAGGGSISKNPNASSYADGTVVTVTATPAAGYTFTGWSGDAGGSSSSVNVSMNSDKTVTASFTPVTYTLTANAAPAAGGTVSKNPDAGSYNYNTVVTLTASPAAGYTFTGWSGDVSGSSLSVNITMNSNKTATANFQVTGSSTTIRIEDNATTSTGLCSYDGIISSNSGASNSKVINLTNSSAKGITWRVNVPSAGAYTLNWRYVNSSSGTATTAKLMVNGAVVNAALSFPKTSGSSVFANTSTVVNLTGGNNDIRLETTVSSSFADIDWIEITGNNPVAGNCSAQLIARIANKPLIRTTVTNTTGVFPNPARGKVNIGFWLVNDDKLTIGIYDSYGRMIDNLGTKTFAKGYQQVVYNSGSKKPGYYSVVITDKQGAKKILKLIVE